MCANARFTVEFYSIKWVRVDTLIWEDDTTPVKMVQTCAKKVRGGTDEVDHIGFSPWNMVEETKNNIERN